jgi:hypothetical protein
MVCLSLPRAPSAGKTGTQHGYATTLRRDPSREREFAAPGAITPTTAMHKKGGAVRLQRYPARQKNGR